MRLAVLLCGILAFAANVHSQSNPPSSNQGTWSGGSFGLSLSAFWTVESKQANSLVLRGSADSADSRLTIESAPIANQASDEAVKKHLRNLGSLPRAASDKELVRQWQLARGKTIAGHDAWLGQHRNTEAGQSIQLVSIAVANETDLLTLTLSNDRSSKTKAKRHAAQRALGDLMKTLTSRDQTALPANQWPATKNDLNGFYATIGGSLSQASFSAHRRVMGVTGLRFDSSGWFALSERGLDKPIESVCETPAQTCGRYTADVDNITTWRSMSDFEQRVSFMRKQQWTLKQEPDDSLLIGGERHLLVSQPEARLLNGRYRAARRSDTRYEETVFSFFDDGQFEESGFIANSGTSGSPISLSDAPAAKAGSFEVDGFTLVLNYLDGERKTHSLFLLGSATVIDGNMFQRLLEPTIKPAVEPTPAD